MSAVLPHVLPGDLSYTPKSASTRPFAVVKPIPASEFSTDAFSYL
jgi:hypothetical protein